MTVAHSFQLIVAAAKITTTITQKKWASTPLYRTDGRIEKKSILRHNSNVCCACTASNDKREMEKKYHIHSKRDIPIYSTVSHRYYDIKKKIIHDFIKYHFILL